jgi:hypothetical protein
LNNPIANATLFPFTSGGTPPYTYAISGGILPSGLSFDTNTGVLSGTPTVASSTSTFTVTVTDAVGRTDSSSINIDKALTVAPTAVMTYIPAIIQQSQTFTPMVVNGGTKPYSYVNTQVPITEMTLDKNTGVITIALPANSTNYYVLGSGGSFTVSDSAQANYYPPGGGNNRKYAYQGVICRKLTSDIASKSGPYNTNVKIGTITGGVPPYIVSYQNPIPSTSQLGAFSLSPISMGQASAALTGTAQADVYVTMPLSMMTCDIVVTDRYNQKLTVPINLIPTINVVSLGPLTWPYGTNPTARASVNVSGGTQPYKYALSGTGAQFFTFSTSTGYIGGGAGAPKNTYNLTVTVTDSSKPTTTSMSVPLAITVR